MSLNEVYINALVGYIERHEKFTDLEKRILINRVQLEPIQFEIDLAESQLHGDG